jgi:hypothetical protein
MLKTMEKPIIYMHGANIASHGMQHWHLMNENIATSVPWSMMIDRFMENIAGQHCESSFKLRSYWLSEARFILNHVFDRHSSSNKLENRSGREFGCFPAPTVYPQRFIKHLRLGYHGMIRALLHIVY